jgi:hypothetical protein
MANDTTYMQHHNICTHACSPLLLVDLQQHLNRSAGCRTSS